MAKSKSSEFLKCFWDLASDDAEVRIAASESIGLHLLNTTTGEDLGYALKRLVKGLSSSRASARLGFSSCLSYVLSRFHADIDMTDLLLTSDESTKTTGSMKGMDEREMMFGKLFFCLAVIRSGRLSTDNTSSSSLDAMLVLDRLLELHAKRGWMKEVTVEALLLLLHHGASLQGFVARALEKIIPLVSDPMADLAAWQISLLIGLHTHLATLPALAEQVCELDLLRHPSEHLDALSATLLAATAGFPKMHRVWDSILGLVFASTNGKRRTSLGAAQQALLLCFCSFLETKLLPSSHEKKGVALRLTIQLLSLAPAEFVPTILSKSVVRLVLAARGNKKHTLHEFALGVVGEWERAVATDADTRLAAASVLVQLGGGNFDALTGSSIVQSLLEGLNKESMVAYLKLLCGIIASADPIVEEDDEGEEVRGSYKGRVSAVGALALLAKNSKTGFRNYLTSAILGIMVRLSCFAGPLESGKTSKSKKQSKAAVASIIPADCLAVTAECVALLEGAVDPDVGEAAAYKLLSLLPELGIATPSDAQAEDSQTKVAFLDVAFAWVTHFSSRLEFTRAADVDPDDEMHPAGLFKQALKSYNFIVDSAPTTPNARVFDALRHFLIMTSVHVLSGDEIQLEVFADAVENMPRLAALMTKGVQDGGVKGRKIVLDEEGCLLALYDVSVEIMCGSEERPVKGVREATKRLWHDVCSHVSIDKELLDKAVQRVVHGFVGERFGDDGEDEDDGSEDEEDEEDDEEGGEKKEVLSGDHTESEDDEEEEEDEEELMQDDAADAALAQMIELRKRSRKQSQTDDQRRELLLSTRCIDFLEIFFRHCEDAALVIPQISPLMTALTTVVSSSSLNTTSEAKGYESKVRSILESKVCKNKLRFSTASLDSADLVESMEATVKQVIVLVRSPIVVLKQLGVSCFIAVAKALISSTNKELVTQLGRGCEELLREYFSKKNSSITTKLFDELILRLPDLSVEHMCSALVDALDGARTPFLLTDAFKMYCALLKKSASCTVESRELLVQSIGRAMMETTSLLTRESTVEGSKKLCFKDLKAKNRTSILSSCKDIAHMAASEGVSSKMKPEVVVKFRDALSVFVVEKGSIKTLSEQACKSLNPLCEHVITGKKRKESSSEGDVEKIVSLVESTESMKITTKPKKVKKQAA